ncbi:MAG: signal peptidase II [Candidatus Auribacterota bacterium]
MWLFVAALLVVVSDQITKFLIDRQFDEGQFIPVIKGLFNITLVYNPGAAFGLFPNMKWFFLFFSVAAIIGIVLIARYYMKGRTYCHILLGLVLGGAIGNLIDRLRIGYVIDFLDVYFRSYHWPAFNIADSAICVGIGLLSLFIIRHQQDF